MRSKTFRLTKRPTKNFGTIQLSWSILGLGFQYSNWSKTFTIILPFAAITLLVPPQKLHGTTKIEM